MHAYPNVCGYARTRCAHRIRYVCAQTDATRARGFNRHPFIYIYLCEGIHLYLDTSASERPRGTHVGVRLWRVRVRVRPRGLHLP